jgi:hypothetical protein
LVSIRTTAAGGRRRWGLCRAGFDGRDDRARRSQRSAKLVAAGKADLAISYQPQLHLQVAGIASTRIGTLIATPLNPLVVLADGP